MSQPAAPTALIADDEPMLRDELAGLLAHAWPELQVVAHARNGREAVALFEAHAPAVCFLDVHMPGLSGIEAARLIGHRAHLVFVTAFDQYALQAFEHGVLDYLVKPVKAARLAETVARLKARLAAAQPAVNTEWLLQQLAAQLQRRAGSPSSTGDARPGDATGASAALRWLRVSTRAGIRLIAVADIDFLRADSKYTLVSWRDDDGGTPAEALVTLPLKELAAQLDPQQFVQVHRSTIVNLAAVQRVVRGDNDTAVIHLKGRPERLPVSRSFVHLFRQM
jgi:DNA-binding LytR/AlgR family response regulator